MDQGLVLAAVLVGIFIVVGLALVAFAARGGTREADSWRQGLGLGAGMLFGGVLGTIVWISTGDFVSWVIFTGGGLVLGLAIGNVRAPKPR
jgi:hypothetical protein